MSVLLDGLTARREELKAAGRAIVEPADAERRNLTVTEQSRVDEILDEMRQLDERIGDVTAAEQRTAAIERSFADLAALPVTGPSPRASQRDEEAIEAFRRAVLKNSREPFVISAEAPRSYYQPGIERRDILTTTTSPSMRPVTLYDRIIESMTDSSGVIRAGATVLTTTTGEDIRVPRSTATSTAAIVAEAGTITESDPTLGVVVLSAYKYGVLVQVSTEMVQDSSVDLQGYLARETGTAIGNALGNHLINGTGTGQPRGVLADATAGVTGPTGTATTFGAQGTAGQGSDLWNSLAGSVAEPYANSPAAAFLARNATITVLRNLKTSTGDLVGSNYVSGSPWPIIPDAFVPALAANAKSVLFGDWSRYFVRIVNGIRFERSDDFAFNQDLVTFRCLLRADGALIDPSAIKYFANSAT